MLNFGITIESVRSSASFAYIKSWRRASDKVHTLDQEPTGQFDQPILELTAMVAYFLNS